MMAAKKQEAYLESQLGTIGGTIVDIGSKKGSTKIG
jgi:hypothetical protein